MTLIAFQLAASTRLTSYRLPISLGHFIGVAMLMNWHGSPLMSKVSEVSHLDVMAFREQGIARTR